MVERDPPEYRDADLARLFQRMRAEDGREAPAFPAVDAAALRARAWSRRLQGALASGAVAATVLVAAGLLVTERGAVENPAALYTDTMNAFALETDQLLSVSESVSPGLHTSLIRLPVQAESRTSKANASARCI